MEEDKVFLAQVDDHIKEVCQNEFDFDGADNLTDIHKKYDAQKKEIERLKEISIRNMRQQELLEIARRQ